VNEYRWVTVTVVLLVLLYSCHTFSPTLRYLIKYMMRWEVSALGGAVIDIDMLHEPVVLSVGVLGFPIPIHTRKLSYRKDDRAMRLCMGAMKISESP